MPTINLIDFKDEKIFTKGPNNSFYVKPHSAYEHMPVFEFSCNKIPNVGDLVQININKDTRLSLNQFSTKANLKNRPIAESFFARNNAGTQITRIVVRIKVLPKQESKYYLKIGEGNKKIWEFWNGFKLGLNDASNHIP